MWNVALSTMWGIKRFEHLGDFFAAGRAAGFTRFELNHGVDSTLLDGVHLNGHAITSVHEPCPADIPVPELKQRDWLISSTDDEKRRQGVAAIRRSIDLAREVGASVVIVHAGRVNMDESLETALRQLYRQGQRETPEYEQAQARMMDARAERAGPHVQAVRRSVAELAEYAAKADIRLGLENRYHPFEIPLPDELDVLLNLGYKELVGYWHDVGHAQALQHLGIGPHEEWLRRFGSRIIGVHLHDIIGIQDHCAAGLGQMDWDMVARCVPAEALRTCEFQRSSTPEQIEDGLKWLVGKGLVSQI